MEPVRNRRKGWNKRKFILPISMLFATPGQIEILRLLCQDQEAIAGRTLARLAGIGHQVCANAVKALEKIGVIKRSFHGNKTAITINRNSIFFSELISPLFKKESELASKIERDIYKQFHSRCYKIKLGDLFYGTKDTVLLLQHKEDRKQVEDIALKLSSALKKQYEARVSFRILTFDDEESCECI